MSAAVANNLPSFRAFIDAVAPRYILRDPFGFLSGYRAYLIYSSLRDKSDSELRRLGLSRSDVPRLAMEAVFEGRNGR